MRGPLVLTILLAAGLAAPVGRAAADPDPARQALAARPLAALAETGAATITPLPGRPLLLHFWASWCVPCRRELPWLDARAARWQAAGLELRVVSIDRDPEKARQFAADLGLTMPLYLDGPDGLAKQLDLPALPCSFVFDGEGARRLAVLGSDARGLERLEASIAELLAAAAAPPTTAAMGSR